MTRQPAQGMRNRLLTGLPAAILKRISPELESREFGQGEIVYNTAADIEFIIFPEDCVLSAVRQSHDRRIEVGTIGFEGASGLLSFLRPTHSPHEVLAQVSGRGYRVPAQVMRAALKSSDATQDLLLRHHEAFLVQISQSVACNGLHTIAARCCRWLLMTHDRVGRDELRLTHEFLSFMLGVHRPGVSRTLDALEKQGLVKIGRGTITVINRPRLKATACECYGIIQHEYGRLLG